MKRLLRKFSYLFLIIVLIVSVMVGYSYIKTDLTYAADIGVANHQCNQSNLYERLACMSTADSVKSKFVSSNLGIDFSNISSDTNGKGLYTLSSTLGDTYPVSYYRGNVNNNNIKFAGFCWKIVRTTDSGGTKLIYNGSPDGSGYCSNTTGASTTIGNSYFNRNVDSLAYNGYMYGSVYAYSSDKTVTSSYVYGSEFSFVDVDPAVSGDGEYTLTTTTNDISELDSYHYTCFNNTGICSALAYIFYVNSDDNTAYYITLNDGKSVDNAISEMQTNTNSSDIKQTIDQWYGQYLNSYTYMIEDTVWCNDRSISDYGGWDATEGSVSSTLNYSISERVFSTYKPDLVCKNKNDAFTKNDVVNGNGALTYPVGLLTADEVSLAGVSGSEYENNAYYLYTNANWYTLSPFMFTKGFSVEASSNFYAINSLVGGSGLLDRNSTYVSYGVRPSISLAHNVVITSGNGASTSPYVVDESAVLSNIP